MPPLPLEPDEEDGVTETADVVVIGAGIVGCSVAYALAKEGARPLVLDRGEVGREASWAGGGILNPIRPHVYPEALLPLCNRGVSVYEQWIPRITEESGVDPEYDRVGELLLVRDDEDEREAAEIQAFKREAGQPVEELTVEQLSTRVPGLAEGFRRALHFPDIRQVRNPRLNRGLSIAAERAGATFRTKTPVRGLVREGNRVLGVETDGGVVHAGTTVLAAGAWSGADLFGLAAALPVKPVRGQIVLTEIRPVPFRSMLLWKEHYIIPRRDGKMLLGSTLEEVGFDCKTTARGVHGILERSQAILPGLAESPFVTAWAGLRPGTPDRLPYIGPVPGADGLLAATGHYRNGLLLGPVTGEIVADLIAGREPPLPLGPYLPGR